jgi:cysteinyl-tRNA synthetase
MFSFFKSKPKIAFPQLHLKNTLSGTLERFEPLNGTVRMYNCGPTVYDYATIGNLRSYVFADTIRRTLLAWGYKLDQVINITDFGHLTSDADEGEDKIGKGLRREGLALTMENMHTLGTRYMDAFLADIAELGVDIKHITFPRASDYIKEQIALIQTLSEKGYTYQGKHAVYFDTAKFPAYGKLGRQNLEGQQAGARVEVESEKKNPNDFVLWKSDNTLGWDSPWGKGFPGWHIECTAMIFKLLGKQIDIHTGGIDHIPVHHNNELAQAEAATGKQFVRYWMHNEFITIEAKRIGKSEGNAILLRSLVDSGHSARALRYWYLTGHYSSPMNFTWDALTGADTALKRLRRTFLELPKGGVANAEFLKDFYNAIANDLDTPKALARVWDFVKDDSIAPADKRASLLEADKILGFGLGTKGAEAKLVVLEESDLPEEVQTLLDERNLARIAKNYQRSDELRIQIEGLGYDLTDTVEGQKITKK